MHAKFKPANHNFYMFYPLSLSFYFGYLILQLLDYCLKASYCFPNQQANVIEATVVAAHLTGIESRGVYAGRLLNEKTRSVCFVIENALYFEKNNHF